MQGGASATDDAAALAASLALAAEPGEPGGTAVDAVIAGVLALAARHPSVFLGACTILLGGVGEGSQAVDGRARHPGLSAPRPRGFVDATEVPAVARVAVPGLPLALARAHTGRGRRSLTALVGHALAAAPDADGARERSLRAFGREAGAVLRESLRTPLLSATARSLGGNVTPEDLEAARAELVPSHTLVVGDRRWSFAPWASALNSAFEETGDGTLIDAPALDTTGAPIGVVCACDGHGAFAAAAVALPLHSVPLEGTGLALPLLATPVLRGVTRPTPGAPVPQAAAIGISSIEQHVDLALGMGGSGSEPLLAQLVRALSRRGLVAFDDGLAQPRARRAVDAAGHATARLEERLDPEFGVATGVHADHGGQARTLVDPRRALTTA